MEATRTAVPPGRTEYLGRAIAPAMHHSHAAWLIRDEREKEEHTSLMLENLGVKAGIVDKSGAWFSYEGERLGQGRENAKQFLQANPAIMKEIEVAIRESAGLIEKKMLVEPTEEDEADNALTEEEAGLDPAAPPSRKAAAKQAS